MQHLQWSTELSRYTSSRLPIITICLTVCVYVCFIIEKVNVLQLLFREIKRPVQSWVNQSISHIKRAEWESTCSQIVFYSPAVATGDFKLVMISSLSYSFTLSHSLPLSRLGFFSWLCLAQTFYLVISCISTSACPTVRLPVFLCWLLLLSLWWLYTLPETNWCHTYQPVLHFVLFCSFGASMSKAFLKIQLCVFLYLWRD